MKKKAAAVLAASVVLAGLADAYFFAEFLKAKKEFQILVSAYNARLDYYAGSQTYSRALGELKIRRHEALYNLGNLTFREGLSKESGALIVSAAEYYKEALRIKPDFPEAKRNLEIAERLIEVLKAKAKGRSEGEKKDGEEGKENNKGTQPGLEPYEPLFP